MDIAAANPVVTDVVTEQASAMNAALLVDGRLLIS